MMNHYFRKIIDLFFQAAAAAVRVPRGVLASAVEQN